MLYARSLPLHALFIGWMSHELSFSAAIFALAFSLVYFCWPASLPDGAWKAFIWKCMEQKPMT